MRGVVAFAIATAAAVGATSAGAAPGLRAPEPRPAATISDATVTEGNAGTSTLSFRVTLSKPTKRPAAVRFATADGTATAGGDYQDASGTIRFKRGEKSKAIDITVVGDTSVESDETLTVTLSNPLRLKIRRAAATGTISNDDLQPRSGRYAGQTSQGKPLSFDVGQDVRSVTHFATSLDVTCTEVPVILRDMPFDLGDTPIGLSSTWMFGFSVPVSETDFSGNVALHGALSTSGPASGSVQVDLAIHANGSTVHCSTETVSWNATPA